MADSLTLRRYRAADRDRVLELHERAMRDVGAYVEGVPEPDLADVEAAYLESGGEFLVGTVDSEVVSVGAFRPAEGYVTELLDDLENAAENQADAGGARPAGSGIRPANLRWTGAASERARFRRTRLGYDAVADCRTGALRVGQLRTGPPRTP